MALSDYVAAQEAARTRWNACHKTQEIGPLTGSDPVLVLKYHALREVAFEGLTVLDIGIGLGGMCRYLTKMGAIVDSMDVADLAEGAVHGIARHFYLASNAQSLPRAEYDLAISHLVAQHQWDAQLRDQIADVYAALKPGGTFSLHLAAFEPAKGELNDRMEFDIPRGMDGSMGRTREYAFGMIREVLGGGYSAVEVGKQMDWPHYQSYWYFVHIKKEPEA